MWVLLMVHQVLHLQMPRRLSKDQTEGTRTPVARGRVSGEDVLDDVAAAAAALATGTRIIVLKPSLWRSCRTIQESSWRCHALLDFWKC